MKKIKGQVAEKEETIEFASLADRKYAELSAQMEMLESRIGEVDAAESRIQEILARTKETKGRISVIKENFETLAEVTANLMDVSLKASMAKEAEKRMAAKRDFETMLFEEEENMKALKLQLEQLQSIERQLAEEYDQEEHRKVLPRMVPREIFHFLCFEKMERIDKTRSLYPNGQGIFYPHACPKQHHRKSIS